MMKSYKNWVIIFVLALAIGGGGYLAYKSFRDAKEPVPAAVDSKSLAREMTEIGRAAVIEDQTSGTPQTQAELTQQSAVLVEPTLPEELNLKMTFYSQAPFGNWDYPWQEACEEASVLLVANEYKAEKWTAEQFNDEILALVEWEKKTFGDYKHTTVKETARILNEYLGLKTLIYENPTYEDIQKIIARGHFVVMTFDGKKIGNPFYKNGGPVYHAMVIKGYKSSEKVITADVGTRRGEDYVYSWKTLEGAFHDWAVPMSDGAKRLIEVIPPTI